MRKPCSLLQDLFTLISEAAFEPQRNLHFPLFRHAGTRIVKPRPRRGRALRADTNVTTPVATTSNGRAIATNMPMKSTPTRDRGSRGNFVEVSPQLELFAAAA
jgi:hypothetical protein